MPDRTDVGPDHKVQQTHRAPVVGEIHDDYHCRCRLSSTPVAFFAGRNSRTEHSRKPSFLSDYRLLPVKESLVKNVIGCRARTAGVLLGVGALGAFAAWAALWRGGDERRAAELPPYSPVPVPNNRGDDVRDGFRGLVHPLLKGQTRLAVAAHWTPLGRGRDELEKTVPQSVYRMFTELTPAVPKQVYTEREFSAFMPETIPSVGEVWEMRGDDVAAFLRQFHPRPSLHLMSLGRRAGPDGAFAVLRAISPTQLDIMFRIHAEFDVAQNVWLTPACFLGRMIVDREAGIVRHFRLWVPTDHPLNVHLTVAESMKPNGSKPEVFRKIERGDVVIARRDIVRVEQMELVSTSREVPESPAWSEAIDVEQALHKLKSAFYVFENIEWVPWNRALDVAGRRQKPILAVILWGALDDQSC
jgi:hypothetical protein